jgi:predicted CXXCH cytochrome family protein
MSSESKLLVASGAGLCASCHPETVNDANGEFGHDPAAEDCLNCHQPHFGDNDALLAEQTPALCTMCHDTGDESLATAHLDADLSELDCLNCHTPHGGENAKLLAGTVHAPLEDGCDLCHEGSSSELVDDGEAPLCLMCHDDVGETAANASFPHAALEVVPCTGCHNPHASAQSSLVRSPMGRDCLECHEDQAPSDGEVLHGVIESIGCQACHQPHGGENARLLRQEGDSLCEVCHVSSQTQAGELSPSLTVAGTLEIQREAYDQITKIELLAGGERGHPTLEHRTRGAPTVERQERSHIETTFDGALGCMVCHDPHKGRSATILRWEAKSATDACMHCHPK